MEEHTESEKDTQPLSSALTKKTSRSKECAAFGCSNTFYDSEGTATSKHFFKFSSLHSEINRWCNLIKRQNNKDGFNVSSNTVLCHHHFTEKDIKESFLRWKLLPGSFPSQNVPGKTTTPKQERKLPVRQQITVKSTPKRNEKTSLSITLPLALPLLNYEEPMTKDVGTQTNNTLFQMLDHDYSLYHNDYSKNIVLESKIQECSTQIQGLKKEICSSNTTVQELKSKKFSLEKIKDDPNAVRFYTGFENYDALIAVFKCLEPEASRMHFWQGTEKYKDGTLKYQNEMSINLDKHLLVFLLMVL